MSKDVRLCVIESGRQGGSQDIEFPDCLPLHTLGRASVEI
jgi:hypothetical protein